MSSPYKICPELQKCIAIGSSEVAAYDFVRLGVSVLILILYFLTIVYKAPGKFQGPRVNTARPLTIT